MGHPHRQLLHCLASQGSQAHVAGVPTQATTLLQQHQDADNIIRIHSQLVVCMESSLLHSGCAYPACSQHQPIHPAAEAEMNTPL